jgi:hypothetical protein
VIYGTVLTTQDPRLKKKLLYSYDEEEDLRFLARVEGRIPEKELIYLPGNFWAGGAMGDAAGFHLESDPERPSFALLGGGRSLENVVVHELIHSLQDIATKTLEEDLRSAGVSSEGLEKDVPTALAISINEALTEALTQVRINSDFSKSTTSENIPKGSSYQESMGILLELFDIFGIKQEDRESTLELLNSKDTVQTFSLLIEAFRKAGREEGLMTFWHDRLQKHPRMLERFLRQARRS